MMFVRVKAISVVKRPELSVSVVQLRLVLATPQLVCSIQCEGQAILLNGEMCDMLMPAPRPPSCGGLCCMPFSDLRGEVQSPKLHEIGLGRVL